MVEKETKKVEKKEEKKEEPKVKAVAKEAKKETPKVEAKTEKKTDAKKEDKKDIKDSKKEEKPKKEKKVKKSRKVKVKIDAAVAQTRRKVNQKQGTPTFRGRFGKRTLRKKSKAKWNKWRFPRGIDVKHEVSEGYNPKEGFRTPKEIRDVHPSGYREFNVKTIQEINNVPDKHAIRVASGLGRKKKLAIVDKAIEKGIKVLNP
ncbi:MAG: hypothetical protein CL944_00950 [Candidatus Diapherotrites archaeon]|uniref:Uncharacterized protein n=1 Tax=Candidatus Iainarchaeum sp. TaxID=3101447 RepID=A0A2D6LPA6_9ARCH|nr:hypothetical protein [Candidatus Diapherotrites archaeon]|tara:strand:+ start:4162 stop:4770 length:609 start_codon:yes stop_codon:yes gene_type:complete